MAGEPYVDYYVVRLWEDLLDLTPTVMQPVPPDLIALIAMDLDRRTYLDDDLAASAIRWYDDHILDLGYIRDPPRVRAWRTCIGDADTVTVAWRHEDGADIRFTASQAGHVIIPAGSFEDAVRQLDRELMADMEHRISELERTGPPRDVEINLDQLRAEHTDRATWLAQRLARQPTTDWAAVRAGAHRLLGRRDDSR